MLRKLNDILYAVTIHKTVGSSNVEVSSIAFDSRCVVKDCVFVAQKGTQVDGHDYIHEAIKNGAIAIVCESLPEQLDSTVYYVQVADTKNALGIIAAEFYNQPSKNLKLVGVTGTNGKTTIVSLLYKLYKGLGYKVGLLSTIENVIDGQSVGATHTTADAIQNNKMLGQMVTADVDYCFMEVSSHSIDQGRISGLHFSGGIFTNLTHEHLDYHLTFNEYLKAKKKFFDLLPKPSFALTNTDDKNGKIMLQNTKAQKFTYGLRGISDFHCKIITNHFDGIELSIDQRSIWFRLIGEFNAYNIMAIYATAVLLGEDKLKVLTLLSNLNSADGRFDQIRSTNNTTVIIDYAHTPDALKNVLDTISSIRVGNEKLITVVGAGGDRDKTKRPIMAQIACDRSDQVILTSDNPRDEDPDLIIEDMKTGLDPMAKKKIISIVKREEAIKTAIALASADDIILLAGKGHEKYQIIKGKSYPLDEKRIVNEALMIN